MEDRKYIIFDVNEINKVNFNEVNETSAETLRKSIDETLTFVKYDTDEMPESIVSLTSKQGPYTHNEILEILSNSFWSKPLDYAS